MRLVALVLSLCVAALGALGIVSPRCLLAIARRFQSRAGLYAAGALRVVLGLALFFAAPASRAPQTLRVLGVITCVAGVITPLFGVERTHRLLDWWAARGPAFMRALAGVALAVGLLLAYAVVP